MIYDLYFDANPVSPFHLLMFNMHYYKYIFLCRPRFNFSFGRHSNPLWAELWFSLIYSNVLENLSLDHLLLILKAISLLPAFFFLHLSYFWVLIIFLYYPHSFSISVPLISAFILLTFIIINFIFLLITSSFWLILINISNSYLIIWQQQHSLNCSFIS